MSTRARPRKCARCRCDLTAKFIPGTRKLKMQPLVHVNVTVVEDTARTFTQCDVCPKCAAEGLRVFLDSILEKLP